jgi:spastin
MYISRSDTRLSDVAGNETAKQALREMVLLPNVRPDLFVGLRTAPRGLLLYGPPGNGKTLLARALANEAPNCHFFNISASSLTSKWVGEGEKTVRALFEVAKVLQPAIIFIDEVDSLLSTRKETDDAVWRLKTEFLIALDGITHNPEDRVTLIAATNIPQRLDQAVLRRFQKRIMVPMPTMESRVELLTNLMKKQSNKLSKSDIENIAKQTSNFSGSDLTQLAKDAAMAPLREMSVSQIKGTNGLRPLVHSDITKSYQRVRPSTTKESIVELEQWTKSYGELSTKNI